MTLFEIVFTDKYGNESYTNEWAESADELRNKWQGFRPDERVNVYPTTPESSINQHRRHGNPAFGH